MDKAEVARVLEEIATFLELKNANPFRVRAYRNAARAVLNIDDLKQVITAGTLTGIKGIGKDLAGKITQLALKGRLAFHEQLKRSVPVGLLELSEVQGLGPKKVQILYKKLRIKSLGALKKACEQGKLSKAKGFGAKTERNILQALTYPEAYQKRHLWWRAMSIAESILKALQKLKGVKKVEIAGSIRRKLETVGDIDILATAKSPSTVMKWFTEAPFAAQILAKGETKASIRTLDGVQVDLRLISEQQFPYAWCYLTGSKEHNIRLRSMAVKRGWSLSEYGLVIEKTGRKIPLALKKPATESDIYQALGLEYIPPELREDLGEFDAAAKGELPHLIEEADVRGTFHNHTTASDGRSTLQEMVAAAEKLGWEYIGISDHSKSSVQANGLNEERLVEQILSIKQLNAAKKFRPYVFTGIECDILPNGTLDFTDAIFKKLDYVVVSAHSAHAQDEATMTKRIIRAIENPYTTMVGHATGRLLLRRKPYAVNLPKVIDACIANKKIMEINCNPQRLDMDWRLWHKASEKGLLCSINTDAHHVDQLVFFRGGVNIARKGWLEKKHVVNTRSLTQMQQFLKAMRMP